MAGSVVLKSLTACLGGLAGCGPIVAMDISVSQKGTSPVPPASANLSDEFDAVGKPKGWKFVHETEPLGNSPIAVCEVKESGWLTLMPRTSTWYRDYRGALMYKEVTGDFSVTTHMRVSGRGGNRPPQSQFSLAGLMVRTPRAVNAQNWTPGRENYLFFSIGSADQTGTWQHEAKTTTNSDSQLRTWPIRGGEAVMRITRRGSEFTLATQEGGSWQVQGRYQRPDMPQTIQVGICTYTDWPSASQLQPRDHNATTIQGGNPDLRAQINYVRFEKP